MQNTQWGPWIDWEGGPPPVAPGTLVDAFLLLRVAELRRVPSSTPLMTRKQFTVIDGASFMAMNPHPVPVWLVYRYRVWGDHAPDEEIDLMELLCGSD